MALTAKQEAFCTEYLIDLNATQAAIRAGYSPDSANEIAAENMAKPSVSSRVAELMALRSERTRISADRVLTELARMGFSDIRDYFTPEDGIRKVSALKDDAAAALQSMKVTKKVVDYDEDGNAIVGDVVEFKLADKTKNLELIGKHLAMFSDKIQITTNKAEDLTDDQIAERLADSVPDAVLEKLIERRTESA